MRHLRLSQLAWRARYVVERRLPAPSWRWRWSGGRPPAVRGDLPEVPVLHTGCPPGEVLLALLRRGRIALLDQERELGWPTDWRLGAVAEGRLWAITLHYHDWLLELGRLGTAEAVELVRAYLADWMERCDLDRPGSRELAWCSYAIATRAGAWVRLDRELGRRLGEPIVRRMRVSLHEQGAYLRDHLERDLLANHLLRDAVGLVWLGRYFDEPAARRWLDDGTELALAQLREQVLPDGGHFERSPMYHLHAMEDVLQLALLVERPAAREELVACLGRMAEVAAWARHPDGGVPLLNDAADNGAARPNALLGAAERLGVAPPGAPAGRRWFPDLGLVIVHEQPWDLFVDVGEVGPACQPGHAHADTLTLEASYGGVRLFVDPGTFGYDLDDRRAYDRSTAAHNTVTVDGQDSSEVWHIFRVGRRAAPEDVRVRTDTFPLVAAGHDGYAHLPGAPHHRRRVWCSQGRLRVEDEITGAGRHAVSGGLLLDPRWRAEPAPSGFRLTGPDDRALTVQVTGPPGLALTLDERPYHPAFGAEVMTTRLGWHIEGPLPVLLGTEVLP